MQITRLEATWKELRREYTESAVLFEKNLKPFMKSLNEGDGEWLCLHRLCKLLLFNAVRNICFLWFDQALQRYSTVQKSRAPFISLELACKMGK